MGELYVGGRALARGYYARPALTAARFLPDPFSPAPGARLYRTGDLARYLPDGTIAYLGRADHQIKIRGQRIEPGEVEAALVSHDHVHEAIVVAREIAPADVRLVAYVRLHDEALAREAEADDTPSAVIAADSELHEQLLTYLSARLPAYMLPQALVVVAPGRS
ncbi:amino acid adenylation domain-containing protein, partial [Candidatus Gracilibacteria bacterium]|nr:amino acid adenylation domain-containing protein [Candidatus Gracilibacteria bacterium]